MRLLAVTFGFMASVALASPAADVSELAAREAEAQGGVVCINCIDSGSCSDNSKPDGCVKVSYVPSCTHTGANRADTMSRRMRPIIAIALNCSVPAFIWAVCAVILTGRNVRPFRRRERTCRARALAAGKGWEKGRGAGDSSEVL